MARLLATKRERWVLLTTKPADPEAVTSTEADAGIRGECFLTTDSRLSATGSTTIQEAAICDGAVAAVPVDRQYEGNLTVFRDLDPETGLPVASGDEVFETLSEFGTRLWVLVSKGPLYTEDFEAGHPYKLYEVITDEPQEPSDRNGSIREVVPVHVQNGWRGEIVAAGG